MSTSIRYAALVIFLVVVFTLVWMLKDGFTVRGGGFN